MSERIILPVLSLGGVRLEPLDVHHETGLREAVCDGEVWKLGVTSAPHPDRVADYIGTALATRLAFAVVDEEADRVVGTTAYYHFEPQIPHLGYRIHMVCGIGTAETDKHLLQNHAVGLRI